MKYTIKIIQHYVHDTDTYFSEYEGLERLKKLVDYSYKDNFTEKWYKVRLVEVKKDEMVFTVEKEIHNYY